MVKADIIGKIREGLTPRVTIVAFQDLGAEIQGEVRYQIGGFGYPVINQVTFRTDPEGKLLEVNPTIKILWPAKRVDEMRPTGV